MVKTFIALCFSAIFFVMVVASTAMSQTYDAGTGEQPDKPILLMKPAELFANQQLRQLAIAAQHGNVKKIDALIAQGVNVNGKGKYGITPLFSAWQARNIAGFQELLNHGANPNNVWTVGDTLMDLLAGSDDPNFLKLALEHGGDPNLMEPETGRTPLLASVIFTNGRGNIPLLIEAGAGLDYQTPHMEETAMMIAAGLGQFKIVHELLEAGADYRVKNSRGWDIRHVITNFNAHNMRPAESRARECVISFLKKHHFWVRIAPPADFRVSTFSVRPGEFYTLSWTAVPGAKTYDLWLNGKIKRTGITDTQIRLQASAAEANSSGNLGWRVRACDDKGCSAWTRAMAISVVEGPL